MPQKSNKTEAERKAKREAERLRQERARDLATRADNDSRVLDFRSWCALNGFSLATGRRILAKDDGPVVVELSERRIGITVASNRRWLAARASG